jgi:hypothetical protein
MGYMVFNRYGGLEIFMIDIRYSDLSLSSSMDALKKVSLSEDPDFKDLE